MGRFLLGFGIGFALGVGAVVLTAPRSGAGLRGSISDMIAGALEAAREASAAEERALWGDFRKRLAKKDTPALPGA
jgi:gas vesicle protein